MSVLQGLCAQCYMTYHLSAPLRLLSPVRDLKDHQPPGKLVWAARRLLVTYQHVTGSPTSAQSQNSFSGHCYTLKFL